MSRDTGGPAFPVNYSNEIDGPTIMPSEGMTLRDYFAAKALQGCLAYSHHNEAWGDFHNNGSKEMLAEWCYEYADAMLKASAKATA